MHLQSEIGKIIFSPRWNDQIVGIMAQVWHYGTGVVLDGNSLR